MAGSYSYLQVLHDAPCNLNAFTTASDGSCTDGNRCFALVGWRDPLELDINRAHFILAGNSNYPCVYENLDVDANDSVTLTWSAPDEPVHHYTAYVKTGTTYTAGDVLQRILPRAAQRYHGNIPWYATSATFDTLAAVTNTRNIPVDLVDTDNDSYLIRGNHMLTLYPGATFTVDGGGTQTVDHSEVEFSTTFGESTRVYITGTVSPGANYLVITVGRVAWPTGSNDHVLTVILNPVLDLTIDPADLLTRNTKGRKQKRAVVNDCPIEAVNLEVLHAGFFGGYGSAVAQFTGPDISWYLHKFIRDDMRLVLGDVSTDGAVAYPALIHGKLTQCSNLGVRDKHAEESTSLTFEADKLVNTNRDRGWFGITDVDTGAKTFTIGGCQDMIFTPGVRFEVLHATDASGLYTTSESTYDSVNDETVITVTTTPAGSTADGEIQIWL